MAAAICFEGCQRVYDAFGFVELDGRVSRSVRRDGYVPGERLAMVQSKIGNKVGRPLADGEGEQRVELYLELEAELARADDGGLVVRDERTGKPYTPSYQAQLRRRIRKEASLPPDLKFTSFRHGGITKLSDSGEVDVRAVSGHKTLNVTGIYNKTTDEEARRIASRRREPIAAITAGAALDDDEIEADSLSAERP